MKIQCVDSTGSIFLFLGQIYYAVESTDDKYHIWNGEFWVWHPKHRFIQITDEKESEMKDYTKMVADRKYIVGSIDSIGKFSVSQNPLSHDTESSAKSESARLAGLNPERMFIVLQIKAGFKSTAVQEI
jgi:hypothetical protein